ncbi:hypothetical protein DPMN_000800 [Dreissena polymorpha]|uniref:Uncharacterized protein n=1 Tax=Dreissena polymorpha TaxID=45954 RepID=A0A9D4RSG7_DREPO|nr:hypothetical protein DPMN_000800 [Dreissena polymorpha]
MNISHLPDYIQITRRYRIKHIRTSVHLLSAGNGGERIAFNNNKDDTDYDDDRRRRRTTTTRRRRREEDDDDHSDN